MCDTCLNEPGCGADMSDLRILLPLLCLDFLLACVAFALPGNRSQQGD